MNGISNRNAKDLTNSLDDSLFCVKLKPVDLGIKSNSGYTSCNVDPLIFCPATITAQWVAGCPSKSISRLSTNPPAQYKSRAWRVSNKGTLMADKRVILMLPLVRTS